MPATTAQRMMPDPSEDDLLWRTAQGDQQAFAGFYDRTVPRVLGLVCRVLKDPAQSEEVAQDVFLELWRTASRFDPAKGGGLSWALTLAHRRAIDRVRASQSSRARDLKVGIRDTENPRDTVSEIVETRVEYERALAAMGQLSAVQREAIELTYFDGLTIVEAAKHAGIPSGTLKRRLHDGLITLRRQLDP